MSCIHETITKVMAVGDQVTVGFWIPPGAKNFRISLSKTHTNDVYLQVALGPQVPHTAPATSAYKNLTIGSSTGSVPSCKAGDQAAFLAYAGQGQMRPSGGWYRFRTAAVVAATDMTCYLDYDVDAHDAEAASVTVTSPGKL